MRLRQFVHKKMGVLAIEQPKSMFTWARHHPRIYNFNTGGLIDHSLPASFVEDTEDWSEVFDQGGPQTKKDELSKEETKSVKEAPLGKGR